MIICSGAEIPVICGGPNKQKLSTFELINNLRCDKSCKRKSSPSIVSRPPLVGAVCTATQQMLGRAPGPLAH